MDELRATRESIFRPEAVRHHLGGNRHRGAMLRLSPRWVHWAYRVLVAFALVALAYLCIGRIDEYAAGTAVVRATQRIEVGCPATATVEEVAVLPGARVSAGQVLVRLRDDGEAGGGETVEERQLERSLVAPVDGVVSEILCRPGEELPAGRTAVTIVGRDSAFVVQAALPGEYGPQLRPGQPARFEPAGYVRAGAAATVAAVADEVVGPEEALPYLGPDAARAVAGAGSLVFLTASLEGDGFTAEGRSQRYADGMRGRIEIRVRSVPILVDLVPGLRGFWETRNDGAPD